MSNKIVIDVSEHQEKINWAAVKPHIDGAIIRCGYGDNILEQDDDWWTNNVTQCEKLGIPFGVFLYSYADSEAHIKSEIEHAKRLLKPHKGKLSYPVYIDLEESRYGAWAVRAAREFCAAMEKEGFAAGVYTFESFYNEFMPGFKDYTLWIAKYGANDGRMHDRPAIGGLTYDAWQYTSKKYIAGYNDRLDISVFYRDFPSELKPGKKVEQTKK
jgi:lysozyme